MGTFSAQIQLSASPGGRFVSMDATVDTGATYSVFPGDALTGLGVQVEDTRTFELADDSVIEFPTGEASITVAGKRVTALVVFGPDGVSPLLGATTLELAGLGVDPIKKILVPVNALLNMGFNGSRPNGVS